MLYPGPISKRLPARSWIDQLETVAAFFGSVLRNTTCSPVPGVRSPGLTISSITTGDACPTGMGGGVGALTPDAKAIGAAAPEVTPLAALTSMTQAAMSACCCDEDGGHERTDGVLTPGLMNASTWTGKITGPSAPF